MLFVVMYNMPTLNKIYLLTYFYLLTYYIQFLRIGWEWNRGSYTKVISFFCILMRPAISFLKSKNFKLFVKKKFSLLYPDWYLSPAWYKHIIGRFRGRVAGVAPPPPPLPLSFKNFTKKRSFLAIFSAATPPLRTEC